MRWYARITTAKDWRIFPKPRYPFHSAVAKQYGEELPIGDHTVTVKEGKDGAERYFIVSVLTTTYVRPLDPE